MAYEENSGVKSIFQDQRFLLETGSNTTKSNSSLFWVEVA